MFYLFATSRKPSFARGYGFPEYGFSQTGVHKGRKGFPPLSGPRAQVSAGYYDMDLRGRVPPDRFLQTACRDSSAGHRDQSACSPAVCETRHGETGLRKPDSRKPNWGKPDCVETGLGGTLTKGEPDSAGKAKRQHIAGLCGGWEPPLLT